MSGNYFIVNTAGEATEIVGEVMVGRSKENGVVLADPLASRHHATLYYDSDVLMIRDEQSVNGTIVNNSRIFAPLALNDGDSVQFGNELFIIRAPLAEAATVLKPKKAVETVKKGKIVSDGSESPKPSRTDPVASGTPPVIVAAQVEEEIKANKSNTTKVLLIAGGVLVMLCLCCVVVGVLKIVGGANLFTF